ncbi:MAG: TetR/AcrR family transcriptional regulator [Sphingobacterium sp.]
MKSRKVQIIEAALKRFAHFGFHKTTMNEIADDLRITKANLYYYYPDKSTLILDSLCKLCADIHRDEEKIVSSYSGDLIHTMNAVLDLRADYIRRYYVLHINENLDWIKGIDITQAMDEFKQIEVDLLKNLLRMAIDQEQLILDDVDKTAETFVEIQKGLGIVHTISDVITGIPNENNVDKIIDSQKRAIKLIFGARIASKTKE